MSATAPPFAKAVICLHCGSPLGFWRNKRHHCRACGKTCCAPCSTKKSTIPLYGFDKEVRVCDSCYDQIHTPRTEVRQSMFELDEEEAVNLAVAISKSEVEASSAKPTRFVIKRTNSITGSKTQCPICLQEKLEWALKMCGHVVCGDCLAQIELCPICGQKPTGAIRIFINS